MIRQLKECPYKRRDLIDHLFFGLGSVYCRLMVGSIMVGFKSIDNYGVKTEAAPTVTDLSQFTCSSVNSGSLSMSIRYANDASTVFHPRASSSIPFAPGKKKSPEKYQDNAIDYVCRLMLIHPRGNFQNELPDGPTNGPEPSITPRCEGTLHRGRSASHLSVSPTPPLTGRGCCLICILFPLDHRPMGTSGRWAVIRSFNPARPSSSAVPF